MVFETQYKKMFSKSNKKNNGLHFCQIKFIKYTAHCDLRMLLLFLFLN